MSRTLRNLFPAAAVATGILLSALTAAPTSAQALGAKVAVIDVRRILTESVAGQDAIETLRKLAEERTAALESRQQEAASLKEQIDSQRLALAESRLKEMERDLQQKMIDLRRNEDDARRDIEERQSEEFGEIEAKVMPLIEAIGREMGFTLIFNKFEDSGLLFAADSADITDEVLTRFDALPEGQGE